MNEQELLTFARSVTANEVMWFGQIITINLAMVVGIYYFLNRAQIALKLFAFGVYLVGMLLYLGEMLVEANVKAIALNSLAAVPQHSRVAQAYLDVSASWLGKLNIVLFNSAFWLLAASTFYLLFVWRREPSE
jgi:hypothetical protein